MSDHDINPLAQAEAEAEILRLNRLLSDITEEYADAVTAHARASIDFDVKEARVQIRLAGEPGTIPVKKAIALAELEVEYKRLELAKAVEKQLSKRSTIMLGQLSALQSISANIRHAVSNSRGRGY